MKTGTLPSLLKLLPVAALLSGSLQADILTVFQDSPDLANFSTTSSTSSDTVVVNGSTTPVSALDGDAIRQWDADSAGRTTMRYLPDTAATSGIQLTFDAYIDAASTGANLIRIGNNAASLAGIKGSGLSMRIDSDGTVSAEVADTVNGGWAAQAFAGAVAAATPFTISAVFNAATAGDLTFPVGSSDLTLAPQTWALFVDNALLATDLVGLNATSTGDGTFTYNPANGAQDIWWLTGGASAESGMDFQYDNITITTGLDIGVVPEPSTTALALSSLVIGLVIIRRLRRR